MSSDYDPRLQALFEQAEQGFDHRAFARDIMARIDRERRRAVLMWSVFGIFAVLALSLFAAPVVATFGLISGLLPESLIEIETGWMQQLLSPINSVAAALALGALGIHRLFRRILR